MLLAPFIIVEIFLTVIWALPPTELAPKYIKILREGQYSVSYSRDKAMAQGTSSRVFSATMGPNHHPIIVKEHVDTLERFRRQDFNQGITNDPGTDWNDKREDNVEKLKFMRWEAMALNAFSHNCIPRFYGWFMGKYDKVNHKFSKEPFIAMERMEGRNLNELLSLVRKRRRIQIAQSTIPKYMADLYSAIHHVHSHGLCHGDLVPVNILLGPHGARLIDFGNAEVHNAHDCQVADYFNLALVMRAMYSGVYHKRDDAEFPFLSINNAEGALIPEAQQLYRLLLSESMKLCYDQYEQNKRLPYFTKATIKWPEEQPLRPNPTLVGVSDGDAAIECDESPALLPSDDEGREHSEGSLLTTDGEDCE